MIAEFGVASFIMIIFVELVKIFGRQDEERKPSDVGRQTGTGFFVFLMVCVILAGLFLFWSR